jgi:hypothetical protein
VGLEIDMSITRMERCFIYSAMAALAVTAVAKLYSATGSARLLDRADPLLLLTHRHVIILVGWIELAVAAYLLLGRERILKLLSVAWLASMFAAYRAGVWWIGAPKACGCLGSLGDLLPVSEGVVNHAMLVILVYLWVGSVGLLVLSRWKEGRSGRHVAETRLEGTRKAEML